MKRFTNVFVFHFIICFFFLQRKTDFSGYISKPVIHYSVRYIINITLIQ